MNKLKKLFSILFLSTPLLAFTQTINQAPKTQRGYSVSDFNQISKKNVKDKKISPDKPKISETFKASVTFTNRKPENSYFPLEKSKPAIVFRMTFGF